MTNLDIYNTYLDRIEKLLMQIKKDAPRHYETALVYQQRLLENINNTKLFGDTASLRAERSRILFNINNLSLSITGNAFTN